MARTKKATAEEKAAKEQKFKFLESILFKGFIYYQKQLTEDEIDYNYYSGSNNKFVNAESFYDDYYREEIQTEIQESQAKRVRVDAGHSDRAGTLCAWHDIS